MHLSCSADSIQDFLNDGIAQWDFAEEVPVFVPAEDVQNIVDAVT